MLAGIFCAQMLRGDWVSRYMFVTRLARNPVHSQPRLSLEPAVGLLVGRADVAHGTADALGVASGAGFSPKVNPLFVDVFPEFVG